MSDSPERPRLGVSACVWRNGKVLIVKRGKPPLQGLWSLPGGHVELGESLRDAARRELREETGIAAELGGVADVAEVIRHDDNDRVVIHYAIVCFAGRWTGGKATPGDDAAEVRWASVGEIQALPMTDGTAKIIETSAGLLKS